MSDDGSELRGAIANQLGRVADRVGSVETGLAKVETAQEFLKRDTEAIRQSQHHLANEMQKLVASESKMVGQLEALALAQTNSQTETATLAKVVRDLNEIHLRQAGGWQLSIRIASIVVACVTTIGALFAVVAQATGILRQ